MRKTRYGKRVIRVILFLLLAVIISLACYVGYVCLTYSRLGDMELSVSGQAESTVVQNKTEYTIITQNFGFGAYTADFTFFMDGGTQSRAESEDSVYDCLKQASETISLLNPDFVFLQEVDTDSTRSFHVNEQQYFDSVFSSYSCVPCANYHSAYLLYPILCPHGKSNSELVTYSSFRINSGFRRSLPIASGFSKFLDLDRCYSISRVDVENGKNLVLFNVHLSAYGTDDNIRNAQVEQLFADMADEYEKGNYVIVGGDFNHDLPGDSAYVLNGENSEVSWAYPFPLEKLPEGFSLAKNYSCGFYEPTCRNDDIPWQEGNWSIIIDGFIVSENVDVTYLENIQTGFIYSDHNPVQMKFVLE